MSLINILSQIDNIAKSIGVTQPHLCGGVPRDKFMNNLDNISDVDITTGDQTIKHLAKETSIKMPKGIYKEMPDGHSKFTIDNINIDFSSNFIMPGIESLLAKAGLSNPTDMQKELYSRDFTCNSLLMTLDLKNILDPINLGINDIKARKIRTCSPARLTLGNDHKRVVRVIYIAAKLNFDIDDEIIAWVKENPQTLSSPNKSYVINKLTKSFEYNEKKTLELLDSLNLWSHLPSSDILTKYINQDIKRI
jgi:poly(A) polymerase